MILYINACARSTSRTDRLARSLLEYLGPYTEIKLNQMGLLPLNEERLNYRSMLIDRNSYEDPIFNLSKQFAQADRIVIAAPYWDGSFPSVLKTYLENIYVTGIVSAYGSDGRPVGLCKASTLYYVTTAGGPYDPSYSYDYWKDMAVHMFGIPEAKLIYAENMDIVGNDPEAILASAMLSIPQRIK